MQDWGDSTWVNLSQAIYEFDINNNRILRLRKEWDGNNWVNDDQTIYEYDENNNLTLTLRQFEEGINWVNFYQTTYEYDDNNNHIFYLVQKWNNNNWVNKNQEIYYYQLISKSSNIASLDFSFQVFPNPVNSVLTLDLEGFKYQNGTIDIYNSVGQLVDSYSLQIGESKKQIILDGFTEGNYFISISTKDWQRTQSFIIAR